MRKLSSTWPASGSASSSHSRRAVTSQVCSCRPAQYPSVHRTASSGTPANLAWGLDNVLTTRDAWSMIRISLVTGST